MMYYRISKNEKNLFFGKKIAQMWAVTLTLNSLHILNIQIGNIVFMLYPYNRFEWPYLIFVHLVVKMDHSRHDFYLELDH